MSSRFLRAVDSGAPAPWKAEERGLEPVPPEGRYGTLRGILWTWMAANIGVLGITMGSGLVTGLGLNLWQAIIAALLGSVGSFVFVAMISMSGPLSGAPAMMASRATFGIRGNLAPTIVSWVVLAGWEVAMCTTATFALVSALDTLGVPTGPWITAPAALFLVTGAAAISYFGHATIVWVQKWLGWVLGGLTLVVCVMSVTTIDWAAVAAAPSANFAAVLGGIGVIAAGTGVGWFSAGGDYTRYLPQTVRLPRLLGATILGAVVPLMVLISTGSLLALGEPAEDGGGNVVGSVGLVLPDWLLVPYLITAMLGLITAADLSMYSSSLDLQVAGLPLSRRRAVLVNAVPIVLATIYISVFSQGFFTIFTTLITLFALPLAAWVGVFGVDLLFRRSLSPEDLADTSADSAYWFRGGFHWPAIGAWVLAIVLGLLCTRVQVGDAVWFSGPLAETWVGRNSLGWLVSGISASAFFWVLEPLTDSGHRPGRAHPEE